MTTPTPQDGTRIVWSKGFARHSNWDHNIMIGDEKVKVDWGEEPEICKAINKAVAAHVRKAVEEFRERAANYVKECANYSIGGQTDIADELFAIEERIRVLAIEPAIPIETEKGK